MTRAKRDRGEYYIWRHMVARCHSPDNPTFPYYGARGIEVCERWRSSFATFVADMGPRPAGMSIERIDNDKNYDPGNCKWATRSEQMRNTRMTRFVAAFGETKPIVAWSEDARCRVGVATLRTRLSAGMDPEWAIATPVSGRPGPCGARYAPKLPEQVCSN